MDGAIIDGAAIPAPVPPEPAQHPRPINAVPLRHWGWWVSSAVLLFFAFALIWSFAHNPNVGWATIGQYLFKPITLRGVLVTIELTLIAMGIGIGGGTIIAVMRLSGNPILRTVAWLYVWLFRGVPLLVQIIFWGFLGALYPSLYLGIPFVRVVFAQVNTSALIGAFTAAILALGLNEMAYAAELVRAAIISVDPGQTEAGLSLGMSPTLIMRRIVLPQAMRVLIPPMGNESITMLKMTSLVSVISGRDLLTVVEQIYAANFKQIPLLIVASIWYLSLTSVLSVGQHYLEAYFGRGFGAKEAEAAEKRALRRAARANA
jgi:polar amino acid transport system permease protein